MMVIEIATGRVSLEIRLSLQITFSDCFLFKLDFIAQLKHNLVKKDFNQYNPTNNTRVPYSRSRVDSTTTKVG